MLRLRHTIAKHSKRVQHHGGSASTGASPALLITQQCASKATSNRNYMMAVQHASRAFSLFNKAGA